jgi:hypothetical protein
MSRIVPYRLKLGQNELELPQHSTLVDAGLDHCGIPVAYYETPDDFEDKHAPKESEELFVTKAMKPFTTKQWAHFKTFLDAEGIATHVMTWYG